MTAPLPVCSAKLSIVWPGQYYGGGPRWNTRCCSFYTCPSSFYYSTHTQNNNFSCNSTHIYIYYTSNLINNREDIHPLLIMIFLNAHMCICNSQQLHNHTLVLHHMPSMNSTQFGSISKHTMNQNYIMNLNSNIYIYIYVGNITITALRYTNVQYI